MSYTIINPAEFNASKRAAQEEDDRRFFVINGRCLELITLGDAHLNITHHAVEWDAEDIHNPGMGDELKLAAQQAEERANYLVKRFDTAEEADHYALEWVQHRLARMR